MKKSFQFQFTPPAEDQFAVFPKVLQKRIFYKLMFFEKSPNPFVYAKKLKGAENIYRFRIGDYRVIVTPQDQHTFIILLILKIGHRREVYE